MLGAAAVVAREGLSHHGWDWQLLLVFAAVLGIGGVGITRRSLVPQVLSRAAAWIVLLPAMIVSFFFLLDGRAPPIEIAALGASTGAALLLARPMLHTSEARAEFAPKAFRRWLLSGSTATAATGFVAGGVALATLRDSVLAGGAFAALAASLFASSLAVVRMRSWGIFLGALTSAVLMLTGMFLGRDAAVILSLAAAPALLMHLLPVLVARWSADREPPKLRVTDELGVEPYATAHYRVATDDLADVGLDEPAKAERAAMRA